MHCSKNNYLATLHNNKHSVTQTVMQDYNYDIIMITKTSLGTCVQSLHLL